VGVDGTGGGVGVHDVIELGLMQEDHGHHRYVQLATQVDAGLQREIVAAVVSALNPIDYYYVSK
jgi:hypothetical protein